MPAQATAPTSQTFVGVQLPPAVQTHTPLAQAEPLPQAVPSATEDHAEVLPDGWHTWQESAGLKAPLVSTVPLMSHCATQAPCTQISPVPQAVPGATGVPVS